MPVTIHKPNPYEQHLTAKPVTAHTTVIKSKSLGGGQKQETLLKDEHQTLGKPLLVPKEKAHLVSVGGGMTVSLGAGTYEFARIDIRLEVPCTKDEIEEAYDWASEWVSEKIQKAVADAKGQS